MPPSADLLPVGDAGVLLADLLARCTFPLEGGPVTCAVSGGADSLALLALACAAGLAVTAVHVDHGLRAGSDAEAAIVGAAAARFGAAFRSVAVDVAAGPNLEARARAARYAVLPSDVLTGHTADDQAETILLNLLRGSGLDGLAGMRAERHPLLRLRRVQTHALCAALDLAPVHDPSNDELVWRRNRVRHQLLPLLDEIAERDVVALLARQCANLADERDLLDQLAMSIDPTDARAIAASHPALARRAIRRCVGELTGHPPDAAAVERVRDVAAGHRRACELSGGLRVTRSSQRLSVERCPSGPVAT